MTSRFISSAALSLCLVALLPSGIARALETPPPPGKPRELKLPSMETFKLANGLQVTFIPFGSVPKVTMSLRIRAGRLDEGQKFGVADFMTGLMNEGAAGLSAVDIAKRAGDMGGQVSVSNGIEFVTAATDVLSEHGPAAAKLLADVVRRPNLPDSELPRLKQDALRAIAISKTDPQALADDAFTKAFLPGHPFGHGDLTEADVKAVGIDDIRRFHAEKLGANRAHLYVAGQFDAAAMRQAIEASFGDWQAGPAALVSPPKPADKLRVVLVDRPAAPQSTIFMGVPLPAPSDPARVAMAVTDELLSGSFTSRITLNLREEKGYTYSPGSSLAYGTGYGQWLLTADVTSAHTGDSLREIFKEIKELGGKQPPVEELTSKQNSLAGMWVLRTATRGGIISSIAFYDTHGLPRTELEQYVSKVRSVTPVEISNLTKSRLRPDAMTIVIVGDLKDVRSQLKSVPEIARAVPKP